MSELSLDEVLAGTEVPETVEESKDETTETGETEETTEVVESKEEAAEVEEEPPSSKEKIPDDQFKGYLDEREKRQKLEAEVEELRKQIAPKEDLDPVVDPEGFRDQVRTEMRKELFDMRRELMAETHDDWEEAEAWLNEQVGTSAVMRAQLEGSQNILKDGYELWRQHQELQQLKDVDGLKARLRAEVEAEIAAEKEAESKASEKTKEQQNAALNKPSLANVATSKGAATPGELSLEDLLGVDAVSRPK